MSLWGDIVVFDTARTFFMQITLIWDVTVLLTFFSPFKVLPTNISMMHMYNILHTRKLNGFVASDWLVQSS